MICEICQTEKERTGLNTHTCDCEESHECTSCGDIYSGNLIDCGLNAAKIQMDQCPSCTAYDIFHEISLMEKALPEDSEAHRLWSLEMIEKLKAELTKEGDDDTK